AAPARFFDLGLIFPRLALNKSPHVSRINGMHFKGRSQSITAVTNAAIRPRAAGGKNKSNLVGLRSRQTATFRAQSARIPLRDPRATKLRRPTNPWTAKFPANRNYLSPCKSAQRLQLSWLPSRFPPCRLP